MYHVWIKPAKGISAVALIQDTKLLTCIDSLG